MASAAVQHPQADQPKTANKRKGGRPNYNYIHRNLLPVEVHPLPVLIPHNPLSLVAIALSYFTQILAPPQRPTFNGYFSSATSSVHITDHNTIRAFWEMGFFGRGSLSRSEPTWLDGQKKKGITAEENTGNRRDERRQQKLERAKKEQLEIAEQLSKENGTAFSTISTETSSSELKITNLTGGSILKTNESNLDGIDDVLESSTPSAELHTRASIHDLEDWKSSVDATGLPTPPPTTTSSETEQVEARPTKRLQRAKTVRFSPTIEAREFDLSSPVISPIKDPGFTPPVETPQPVEATENKEHLNLSLEEAFFLSYGLGVLNVYCEESDTLLPSTSLLSLFRRHSYHPTRSLSAPVEPDDPFMLSYAVYHHYRSLGWVVRSGVKFSTDYLLYNRGPAFSHAEFAVVVVPSYTHRYWSETVESRAYVSERTSKPWWWLHGVNRVQAQVHKSLVLCYVDVPPPLSPREKSTSVDVGKELSRYSIRDVSVRRWTPNRTRD